MDSDCADMAVYAAAARMGLAEYFSQIFNKNESCIHFNLYVSWASLKTM